MEYKPEPEIIPEVIDEEDDPQVMESYDEYYDDSTPGPSDSGGDKGRHNSFFVFSVRRQVEHVIVGFEDGLGLVNLEDGSAMCLKCNRSFCNPNQAKVHFKEIHMVDKNDRKFNCHLCSKSFAIKRYLSNHLRAIHGLSQTLLKHNYMPT